MAAIEVNSEKIGFIEDIIEKDISLAVLGSMRDLESVTNSIKAGQYFGTLSEKNALRLTKYATILLSDGKKMIG